jgi:phosphoribosylaminoimidazolecarboxamide formyltransferase/IMP cyclohydrolase
MRRRALISVFDKTGITDFAKSIVELDWEIIASKGTAKVLEEAGIFVIPIEEITGNPECFSSRVKTISFRIGAAILYDRRNPRHLKEAQKLGIQPIDMVVCNLYPFEKMAIKKDCSLEEAVENIDIGGLTILRAAAKNHSNVIVVSAPRDYEGIISHLESQRDISEQMRLKLARKVFSMTAQYDRNIATFLENMEE